MSMASCLLHNLLIISFAISASTFAEATFTFDDFYLPTWGHVNVGQERTNVELTLDRYSGGGFRSKTDYCFGKFEVHIKLPKPKTAGVVTSFYMTSVNQGENGFLPHNEFDFEFIGTNGILQTNIFANDNGHREERIRLWFDPSDGYHKYVIAWYPPRVVFYVDDVPIRVVGRKSVAQFSPKPMHIEASLWNGTWAGHVNWGESPFTVSYGNFTNKPVLITDSYGFCDYNKPISKKHWSLNSAQKKQYREIRKKYLLKNWKLSSEEKKE